MSLPEYFTFEQNLLSFDSFGNEPNYFSDYIFPEGIPSNLPFPSNIEPEETIEICIDNKVEDRGKDETKETKNTNLGRKTKEKRAQNRENKKCHDRFGKDNLKLKVQSHYMSFIIDYVNYILPFLGYRIQFYKISYKEKIQMKISSLKDKDIGEILQKNVSPSYKDKCDENKKIFNEIKDEPGVKDLFSEKYLELFENIYYKNKRYINLSNYGKDINIYLPNKRIKMFEDLLEKANIKDYDDINNIKENRSNEDYKEVLKKFVENKYLKNLI